MRMENADDKMRIKNDTIANDTMQMIKLAYDVSWFPICK